MSVLYLIIPLTFLLVLGFVGAFVWAARTGQYDDLETPAHRMLLDSNQINRNPHSNNLRKEGNHGEHIFTGESGKESPHLR